MWVIGELGDENLVCFKRFLLNILDVGIKRKTQDLLSGFWPKHLMNEVPFTEMRKSGRRSVGEILGVHVLNMFEILKCLS